MKQDLQKLSYQIKRHCSHNFAFRDLSRADVFPLWEATRNEDFNKHLTWSRPDSLKELIQEIDKLIQENKMNESLSYSIIYQKNGQWAGFCKFGSYLDGLMLSLWIHPDYWKTKAAYVAIDSMIHLTFEYTKVGVVYARVVEQNSLMNKIVDFDESISEILSKAELTLKKAKKSLFLFEEYSENIKNYKTFELSQELKKALDNRTLKIEYQPQIDMIEEKVYGVEELLRWEHETKGNISPGEFLKVAEDYNLMFEIDKYVLIETLNDMAVFRNNGILTPVSINLSSKSLCSEAMPNIIETLVNKLNLPKNLITIEITENSLMENIEISKKNIAAFKECGFKISLDDFGTGYSSMSYLMRYPTNILKIDREFIKNIDTDESSQIITTNIIKLGQSLGMFVVAEGVETKHEKETLKMLSCNAIQGFYYAKSMKKDDLILYINKIGVSNIKSRIN